MTVPAWLGSLICRSDRKRKSATVSNTNKRASHIERRIEKVRQHLASASCCSSSSSGERRHRRQSNLSAAGAKQGEGDDHDDCCDKGYEEEEDEEPVRIVRANSSAGLGRSNSSSNNNNNSKNSAGHHRHRHRHHHHHHQPHHHPPPHHLHPQHQPQHRRPRSAPPPPPPPAPRPASPPPPRFSPAAWEAGAMDAATVTEVITCIGRLFHHIPYAVCGTAALVFYGYDSYFPDHVSITCPEESKEAIRCWAVAQGMTLSPSNPDGFSVRTADGRFCAVCIKFMKSGFDGLHRIRVGPAQTSIVTLPSIANTIARSYVFRLHNASPERQALYARYLSWALRRIAALFESSPDQRLTPARARDIIDRAFWVPFTLSYPETVPLFAAAGLELHGDAPRQWQLNGDDEALSLSLSLSLSPPPPPSPSQRRPSSHRVSFNLDSDYDSENTPSLRRVTKRLPGTRPLLAPSAVSSPSNSSDSEFSPHASPQFVLSSHSRPPPSSHSRPHPSSIPRPVQQRPGQQRPGPAHRPTPTNGSPQQPVRRRGPKPEETKKRV